MANEPCQLDSTDLLYSHRTSILLTQQLLTSTFPYTSQIKDAQTQQHDRPQVSFLLLAISTGMQTKKLFIAFTGYVQSRKHKLSFLTSSQNSRPSSHRPISLSLSLSPTFYNNDLTRTTKRSGESQTFGQDHPATNLFTFTMFIKNSAFLPSTDPSISSKLSS
jgi:hypothetical protein